MYVRRGFIGKMSISSKIYIWKNRLYGTVPYSLVNETSVILEKSTVPVPVRKKYMEYIFFLKLRYGTGTKISAKISTLANSILI